MAEYLFIYGTLITGTPSATVQRCLQQYCRIFDHGYVCGKLYNLGRYPAALPSSVNSDKVFGQLLQINNPRHVWPILDAYEGDEYKRELVSVYLPHRKQPAWIYWFTRKPLVIQRIANGDYTTYKNTQA